MAAIPQVLSTNRSQFPGAGPSNNILVKSGDINPLIRRVNSITTEDGVIDISGDISVDDLEVGDDATILGDIVLTGVFTQADTTDSTSKDTGAMILEGGLGVEKAIFNGTTINSGTSIAVGTSINVGTNQTFTKEVNHTVSATTTTTAATAGGNLTITAGIGATTGAGGNLPLAAGAGGNDAVGGVASLTGGAAGGGNRAGGISKVVGGAGAGSAAGGDAQVTAGAGGSTGAGGAVTITSGAGGSVSGASGDVTVGSAGGAPGTYSAGKFKITIYGV